MTVEIKFCGMTRPEDAAHAASLGAAYIGVIFAGGPRQRSVQEAAVVLSGVGGPTRKVGVFGDQSPDEICTVAKVVGLDVVQLHGGATVERVRKLRECFDGDVWLVVRLAGDDVPADFSERFEVADALVLDAFTPGALGGTGVTLPWTRLARAVAAARHGRRLVLAGGLQPENVAVAIAALSPDVVDVSSGVESTVGVKDHDRMRAFRDAVADARLATESGESLRR